MLTFNPILEAILKRSKKFQTLNIDESLFNKNVNDNKWPGRQFVCSTFADPISLPYEDNMPYLCEAYAFNVGFIGTTGNYGPTNIHSLTLALDYNFSVNMNLPEINVFNSNNAFIIPSNRQTKDYNIIEKYTTTLNKEYNYSTPLVFPVEIQVMNIDNEIFKSSFKSMTENMYKLRLHKFAKSGIYWNALLSIEADVILPTRQIHVSASGPRPRIRHKSKIATSDRKRFFGWTAVKNVQAIVNIQGGITPADFRDNHKEYLSNHIFL